MSGRIRARGAGVIPAILFALVVSSAVVPATAAATPTVRADRTGTKAGERVFFAGEGWAPGTLVLVELCGRAALRGSIDCDVANGQVVATTENGTFYSSLVVALPPSPCPCVLRAIEQNRGTIALGPIAVQGLATIKLEDLPELPLPLRAMEITNAKLDGYGPWTAWLGGPAERVLRFTVRNTGNVTLRNPTLSIAAGQGAVPSTIVDPPEIGTLAPGQSRSFRIPLRTESLAFGFYAVRIEAHGFGSPVVGRTRTLILPWGLIAIALVLIVWVIVRVRRARRRARMETELAVPTDAVIDLTDTRIDLSDAPASTDGSWHALLGVGITESHRESDLAEPVTEIDLTEAEADRPQANGDLHPKGTDRSAEGTRRRLPSLFGLRGEAWQRHGDGSPPRPEEATSK